MPETGEVEILDYVVVEDGGVLVNPMIVDGQIWGGAAQGIGTALYEEMRFDAQGQPLASTLSDYLLPGPTEVPDIRIVHMETPSPYTRFGQKGIGEGGAIAPPAAITNAVNDALQAISASSCWSRRSRRGASSRRSSARRTEGSRRMKPVAFDYARPCSVDEAVGAARRQRRMPRCWPAGRRSVRCSICASPSPRCWSTSRASPSWRPCTRTPTPSRSARRSRTPPSRTAASPIRPAAFSRRVARGIAYRAVRTRGTIGGSLAHADPAADWLSCLTALGAEVVACAVRTARAALARRRLRARRHGDRARPRRSSSPASASRNSRKSARFGYHKICRKTGEFAEAIGVAVHDPDRDAVSPGRQHGRRRADRAGGSSLSSADATELEAAAGGSRPRPATPTR